MLNIGRMRIILLHRSPLQLSNPFCITCSVVCVPCSAGSMAVSVCKAPFSLITQSSNTIFQLLVCITWCVVWWLDRPHPHTSSCCVLHVPHPAVCQWGKPRPAFCASRLPVHGSSALYPIVQEWVLAAVRLIRHVSHWYTRCTNKPDGDLYDLDEALAICLGGVCGMTTPIACWFTAPLAFLFLAVNGGDAFCTVTVFTTWAGIVLPWPIRLQKKPENNIWGINVPMTCMWIGHAVKSVSRASHSSCKVCKCTCSVQLYKAVLE